MAVAVDGVVAARAPAVSAAAVSAARDPRPEPHLTMRIRPILPVPTRRRRVRTPRRRAVTHLTTRTAAPRARTAVVAADVVVAGAADSRPRAVSATIRAAANPRVMPRVSPVAAVDIKARAVAVRHATVNTVAAAGAGAGVAAAVSAAGATSRVARGRRSRAARAVAVRAATRAADSRESREIRPGAQATSAAFFPALMGSRMKKLVPFPISVWNEREPPWLFTTLWAMDSP